MFSLTTLEMVIIQGLNNETFNKASGILSLGLLSSINNFNYGNIYGKNLASGIYGFVFHR